MEEGKTHPPPMAMAEVVATASCVTSSFSLRPWELRPGVDTPGPTRPGPEIREDGISAEEAIATSPPASTESPPLERRGPEGRLMEVFAIKL